MTKLKKLIVGLGVAFVSLWVGAGVLTLLPDGTVALHLAAIVSTLIGLIGGVLYAVADLD